MVQSCYLKQHVSTESKGMRGDGQQQIVMQREAAVHAESNVKSDANRRQRGQSKETIACTISELLNY